MSPGTNFFYSNLFIAIITFVVGIFGLYLYHRRKQDFKRRAARIILLEIRNAENQLKDARAWMDINTEGPLPEHLYAMPSDSWSDNKHLFVDDLKPTEWNSINEFYDLCQLYDEAIKHNDSRFAEQEKEVRRNVHKVMYKYAVECGEASVLANDEEGEQAAIDTYFKYRDSAVRIITDSDYMHIYTAVKQIGAVNQYLKNVNFNLSTSTVGQKLEKLSKSKLWIF